MYRYTQITSATDEDGDTAILDAFHFEDGKQYEVVLRIGRAARVWDAADPAQRAELQKLVDGIKEVIADGAAVQATGSVRPRR